MQGAWPQYYNRDGNAVLKKHVSHRHVFNLQQVCRQTRQETAGLNPYVDNVLGFERGLAYKSMMQDRIPLEQHAAIHTIALAWKFPLPSFESSAIAYLPFAPFFPI
jgi:hypothetical protein